MPEGEGGLGGDAGNTAAIAVGVPGVGVILEAVVGIGEPGREGFLGGTGGPVISRVGELARDLGRAGGEEVEGSIGQVEGPDVRPGAGVGVRAEGRGDGVAELEGVQEFGVVHPVASADDGAGGDLALPVVGFPAAAFPPHGAVLGEGEEAEVAALDDGEVVAGPLAGTGAGSV